MKLFSLHVFFSTLVLALSFAAWWYSYDLGFVRDYQLGDLWRYWDKFNEAWAFASAFGAAYCLLLAVSKKEKK